MPTLQGFAHVACSVSDSQRSAAFYAQVLDGHIVDASDDISPFHVVVAPPVVIGFRAHGSASGAFDHHRIGLDHLAFAVPNAEDLQAWLGRLDDLGVENSGIVEDPAGLHLNARDPDNLAIEFYVPPS